MIALPKRGSAVIGVLLLLPSAPPGLAADAAPSAPPAVESEELPPAVPPQIILKSDGSTVAEPHWSQQPMRPDGLAVSSGDGRKTAPPAADSAPAPLVVPVVIPVEVEPPFRPQRPPALSRASEEIERTQQYLRTERLLRESSSWNRPNGTIVVLPSTGLGGNGLTAAEAELRQLDRMRVLDRLEEDSRKGSSNLLIVP